MKTYVLGCGPAGLTAAHAAVEAGDDVYILSRKRKSQMFGAQYLHAPIPGIKCGSPVIVKYTLHGTTDQYRRKVYGEAYDGTVSPEDLPTYHDAWDIRAAYDDLWDKYENLIQDMPVNRIWMSIFANSGGPKRIINSIPLPILCQKPADHQFSAIRIWAAGEAPEIGRKFPRDPESKKLVISGMTVEESSVICNGELDPFWYRTSLIFGRATVEWPHDPGFFLPEEDGALVSKPINTTCTCWPHVLRVGRYGTWRKGVLVHHAYRDVEEWISSQS